MTTLRRILCPTDFSPMAAHAAAWAASLARPARAEIVLLHVLPELSYPVRGFGLSAALPQLEEELKRRSQEQLAQAKAALADVACTTELRDGRPHEVILAVAKERQVDMIVMGTAGHTGLAHALLGSVAERVVRLATCPVLTVRAPN